MKKLLTLIAAIAMLSLCFTGAFAEVTDVMAEFDLTSADVEFVANIFKQINEGKDPGLNEDDYYDIELKLAKLGAAMGNGELALWVGEIYQGCHVPGLTEQESLEIAFQWWEKAVELGQPRGWTNIGLVYMHSSVPGGGKNFGDIEQNDAIALEYLLKANELGDVKAPRHIALMYESGRGTEQNFAEALKHFEIAAGLSDITANYYAGNYYFEGKGTEQDYAKAFEFYMVAASNAKTVPGVSQSRYMVGYMYENGLNVEANVEEAIKWYQASANDGNEDAKAALERLGK